MKLLICTQVVDQNHPILGFFHRWIEEFATHCEHIHVICLEAGEYSLPANVTVHSLGKEVIAGRLHYVWHFYTYTWRLRKEYDHVFVHMNQIYVLLGALLWRFSGKQIGLWYMHGSKPLGLRLAVPLTNLVFTGSSESFPFATKKLRVTGHGIDTALFTLPAGSVKKYDLITVGRISKSKNLELLIEALAMLEVFRPSSLTMIGEPITPADKAYAETLRALVAQKGLTNKVTWYGKLPQAKLPAVLAQSEIFVSAAQNGSLDKALLEPLVVGIPLITCAPGAQSLPLGEWQVANDPAAFATTIRKVLQSTHTNKVAELKDYVVQHHSLTQLIPKILKSYDI